MSPVGRCQIRSRPGQAHALSGLSAWFDSRQGHHFFFVGAASGSFCRDGPVSMGRLEFAHSDMESS